MTQVLNSTSEIFMEKAASFKSSLHFFRAIPICRDFFPKDCKALLESYEGCRKSDVDRWVYPNLQKALEFNMNRNFL